ncbi:hypothetical protein SLEP1_g2728 [Rubroshorea leprosula]|uniref:SBP-type domain-containing protein n=1 Tax=Rubroshorea leprosula TaxID=152421 RepID=A0AAV5HI37_9ROSI|nr:hypothetical protein SLEP1_g2728 [Rubroshorea leprosula]
MLEYEWGNPSTIMLSGDQPTQEDDPARQIFDYSAATANQQSFNQTLLHHQNTVNANVNAFSQQNHFHNPAQAHLHSIYDLRAYSGASAYGNPHPSLPSLDSVSGGSGGGYVIVPKREEITGSPLDFTARIGLNLGRRTYFSSAEDEFVNRLYRRSRAGDTVLTNSPRCQAEGCHADLTHSKHYHRRHKVCEFHSKAATVIAAGLTQRFCQQCSRFHLLSEFDNGKRSCRKRLADHNRRRRKSLKQQNQENQKSKSETTGTTYSTDHNLPKSPPDSGVQASSSVTIAVSPPRISLDCFRQRTNHATASSSSSSSLFFSNG